MRYRRTSRVIAALVVALLSTSHAFATAGAQSIEESKVYALAEKAVSGPLTDEEVNYLVKNNPEIAAALPDYRPGSADSELEIIPLPSMRSPGQGCSRAVGTHHSKTLLGFRFYDMTTWVDFCWNAGGVYHVAQPYTRFEGVSSMARVGHVVDSAHWGGNQGYARHSYLVENVVPHVGTLSAKYPYNEFDLFVGGGVSHRSGE